MCALHSDRLVGGGKPLKSDLQTEQKGEAEGSLDLRPSEATGRNIVAQSPCRRLGNLHGCRGEGFQGQGEDKVREEWSGLRKDNAELLLASEQGSTLMKIALLEVDPAGYV